MVECELRKLNDMKKTMKPAEIVDKIVNKEIIVDCSVKDFLDVLSQKKYDIPQE